jgi:putative transposase
VARLSLIFRPLTEAGLLALYVLTMSRRPRNVLGDGVFHVTARANDSSVLFRDDVDRTAFVSLLARTACAFGWTCYAYCLMTTHYHLLLETSQSSLSGGMHRLNGIYAQGFNRRHSRRGHVFEQRFSAYVVDTDEHFEAACHYVLQNPVRSQLCTRAEEWPWSGGLVRVEELLKTPSVLPPLGTVPR